MAEIPDVIEGVSVFQAEDGIRYWSVTGVQTCVLLISSRRRHTRLVSDWSSDVCSSDLIFSQRSPCRARPRRHRRCSIFLRTSSRPADPARIRLRQLPALLSQELENCG